MNISFGKHALPDDGAVLVLALEKKDLLPSARALDDMTDGQLTRAAKASRFTGAAGEMLEILAPAGTSLSRVLVAGLGAGKDVKPASAEKSAAAAVKRLLKSGEAALSAVLDPLADVAVPAAEFAARFALGARLEGYEFGLYRTKEKPSEKSTLKKVSVLSDAVAEAKKRFAQLDAVAGGVSLARNLVMEPANILSPPEFAKRVQRDLGKLGVEVEVLGEKAMAKLGMNAILGVGQGSDQETQLVVMTWMGAGKTKKPIALVGKGVTFDTGGISLKPGPGMDEMKGDMGGAAAVVGVMHALASRKAKVNAVGVIGVVENMPDAKAQRPGDIVKSMSGQTIEILNTDAEGRLVLADALTYTQQRFNPEVLIDLATLTGAVVIALGHEYAGLYATSEDLAGQLTDAGKEEGELLWRMPLAVAYDKLINSKIADMKNIAGGRDAGSIVGAQFLKRFVGDVPWAHLDIAGTAWMGEARPTSPAWATGFGVRLLNRFIADNYEK